MERKYYLRGLGLGIIITAIIMGFAGKGKPAMTDEEIMQRAKELGMIENTMLTEPGQETAPADTAKASDEKTVNTETAKPSGTDTKTDTAKTTDTETESDTAKTADTEAKTDTAKPSDAETKLDTAKASDIEAKTDTVKASDSETKSDTAKPTDAEADTTESSDTETDTDTTKPSATGAQSITIVNGDSSVSVAAKLEQAGLISSASSYDSYLCSNGYDKKIRPGDYSIPADAGDEEIARIITGAQP